MLERAHNFLNYYQDVGQVNLGVNFYLLSQFVKAGIISHADLRAFIREHKDDLTKIDYRETDAFTIDGYLERVDPSNQLKRNGVTDRQLEKVKPKIIYLAEQKHYEELGRSGALVLDLNVSGGEEDLHRQNLMSQPFPYRLDSRFPQWPINQMGTFPLYAARGFTEDCIIPEFSQKFPAGGFFYEVLNLAMHADRNISHIVAIGNAGVEKQPYIDFPKYFKTHKVYTAKDDEGNIVNIKVTPEQYIFDKDHNYITYPLTCTITDKDGNETKKSLTVLHIPAYDGMPIMQNDKSLSAFYDALIRVVQSGSGVVVHCQSGFGRTGQILAETMVLAFNKVPDLFKDNDHDQTLQRIRDFIEVELRSHRPGLLLELKQFYQFLANSIRYLELHPELIVEQNNSNTEKLNTNFSFLEEQRRSNENNNAGEPKKESGTKRKLEVEEEPPAKKMT